MTDLAAANATIHDLYTAIGQRLRAAREQHGVTQQDLANAIGLTRASVGNIETGNQRIQVHTLIAAAQALGLDPVDLISGAMESTAPLAAPLPAQTTRLRRQLLDTRDHIDALIKTLPASPA